MSIIYDALKKAQSHFTFSSPEQKKPGALLWIGVALIFLGFLGCGFALMLVINSANQKTVVKLVPPQKQAEEKKPILNIPMIFKSENQQLVLNGIITMEGEYLALINNQILKEGDYVQNMRIISITKDRVELYSKGKLILLTQK